MFSHKAFFEKSFHIKICKNQKNETFLKTLTSIFTIYALIAQRTNTLVWFSAGSNTSSTIQAWFSETRTCWATSKYSVLVDNVWSFGTKIQFLSIETDFLDATLITDIHVNSLSVPRKKKKEKRWLKISN